MYFSAAFFSCTQIWYIDTESMWTMNSEECNVVQKWCYFFLKLWDYIIGKKLSVCFSLNMRHPAWLTMPESITGGQIPSYRKQMHTVCSSKIYWYRGHTFLQYLIIISISSVIAWLPSFLTGFQWETFAIPFSTPHLVISFSIHGQQLETFL